MLNAMVMHTVIVLDQNDPLWTNLVQKLKIAQLKGTLIPTIFCKMHLKQ